MLTVLDSLEVRISACHVEGLGSIPGRGVIILTLAQRIAGWTSIPKVLGSIPRWDDTVFCKKMHPRLKIEDVLIPMRELLI